MVHEYVISLGSNTENRNESIIKAINWLEDNFEHLVISSVYSTVPEGNAHGEYLNNVVKIKSGLEIENLDRILKSYEESVGRNDDCRLKGIVPIDLDIVIADEKIVREWEYSQSFFRKGFLEICTIHLGD